MQNNDDMVRKLHHALEVMELPVLVSWEDIRKRYRELSRRYHPDLYGSKSGSSVSGVSEFNPKEDKMRDLNDAYALLKEYIFHYRFSFSEEEIRKQYPESEYGRKFRF